jgi:PAT family acetyl-CoA transporter-like MFS transporter 1
MSPSTSPPPSARHPNSRHSYTRDEGDDVELSLLREDERRAFGPAEGEILEKGKQETPLTPKDKAGIALLVLLCAYIQLLRENRNLLMHFPQILSKECLYVTVLWCAQRDTLLTHFFQLGLSLGSIPFILRSKLSYSQLGVFALSAYPYSLKLLWSPIVDSVFVPSIGRRKSWIMPMQIIIGCTMIWIAINVQDLIDNVGRASFCCSVMRMLTRHATARRACFVAYCHLHITRFLLRNTRHRCRRFASRALVTPLVASNFFCLGWALTLLSPENVSYASTAQTVGLNSGFFMSFTCFLALNNVEFTCVPTIDVPCEF